eukprot:IDg16622t1
MQRFSARALHSAPFSTATANVSDAPVKLAAKVLPAVNARSSRTPLVALHGLLGTASTNLSMLRRPDFVPERAKVALDLRNHGRSPHAPGMSYEAQAADVAFTLKEEGIDRAVVVGHSMGGKVAMHLALTRPELVSALVVVDVAPVTYPSRPGGTPDVLRAMQL